jgi:hypothetical protein
VTQWLLSHATVWPAHGCTKQATWLVQLGGAALVASGRHYQPK